MSAELDSAMKSANTLIGICGGLLAERDRLKSLNADLAAALMGVIGWVPGRAAWQTDGPAKAVELARAVLEKNRGEPA